MNKKYNNKSFLIIIVVAILVLFALMKLSPTNTSTPPTSGVDTLSIEGKEKEVYRYYLDMFSYCVDSSLDQKKVTPVILSTPLEDDIKNCSKGWGIQKAEQQISQKDYSFPVEPRR